MAPSIIMVICLQLLLVIVAQGYLVQSADNGNDVSDIESIIESIMNEGNDNKHKRHERITLASDENYHTNEGRGRRTKRNWAGFEETMMTLWKAFLNWLKNSWSSIEKMLKNIKF